ncbi:MAG: nitrile hydratase accessory protein [Hyphomicrobiaceae bacterium]|nr:nitrile hydratase accessory protein [Hyphomicrobiaceae bacterium]
MSRSEAGEIRPLARHDGDPVFDEPWQAQALGLAFTLAERGVFTPAQWSQTLGAKHRQILARGAADNAQTYYEAVVSALEALICDSGKLSADLLDDRTRTWRRAYLNTPHGNPVLLSAGEEAR